MLILINDRYKFCEFYGKNQAISYIHVIFFKTKYIHNLSQKQLFIIKKGLVKKGENKKLVFK